jgi:hypothetical protein
LRHAVDDWINRLDEADFIAHLPLLRRVFSRLDGMERKRLLAAVLGQGPALPAGFILAPDGQDSWRTHLEVLRASLVEEKGND